MREIEVPQDWEDITVGKYIEFRSTIKQDLGYINLALLQVSILCDVDMDICERMSLESLRKIRTHLNKFLHLPKELPSTNMIKLGDITIGYEPNIDKWEAGQYIDFTSVLDRGGNNMLDILNEVLATIFVPVHEKKLKAYDYTTKSQIQELVYNEMNMRDALGVCFFFSKIYGILINDSVDYLEKKAIKKMREAITAMKE